MKAEPAVKIGEYVVHPYRVSVPEMPPDDLASLTAWTKARGQRYDIKTDRENRILDGRAQLRACLAAGVTPKFTISDLADEPAQAVIESMHRARYTHAQCGLIALDLAVPLAKEARRNQRTAGKPHPQELRKGEALELAAKSVGKTNRTSMRELAKIVPQNPGIVKLIRSGKIPHVSQALTIAAMPDKTKKSALKALDAGADISLVIERRKKADDEWLTPSNIADAIRAAFDGQIMCDPCAPPNKKSNVRAKYSYSIADNGLDRKNRWYDRTFVNPPFSSVAEWVNRALEEATAFVVSPTGEEVLKPAKQTGKRIYVLLPVRPDSDHQNLLISKANDVLLLADRIPFGKPNKKSKSTGRISVMIAALNCSSEDLVDNGVPGLVVKSMKPWFSTSSIIDDLNALDKAKLNV